MIGEVKRIIGVIGRAARHRVCRLVNGGHELYPSLSRTRLCEACLLCGYETPGWKLDAEPRFRAHLPGRGQKVVRWQPPRRAGGRR